MFTIVGFSQAALGCVGAVGTLMTKCTQTKHAVMQEVYTVGLEGRNRPYDAGVTIGYRHSVYLYPATTPPSAKFGSWTFGIARALRGAPAKQLSTEVGIELKLNSPETGLLMGYGQQALSVYEPHRSEIADIHYTASDPRKTEVTMLNN